MGCYNMNRLITRLFLLIALLVPGVASSQSQGWFTRTDCSAIDTPSSVGLRCLATATAGVFTANHVYRWSGSAWVDTGLATEIINTPAGNVSSTTVQAAINELDSEKLATGGNAATASALAANGANCSSGQAPLGVNAAGAVESCFDVATQAELDAHVNDATDAHAGTAITNTPAGGIAATTAQAAINELDTEKLGATTPLVSTNIAKVDVMATSDHCADAGSTDTYACNLSPAITAYGTGVHYYFLANTINTGAASINFNSVGAKTIVKLQGAINTTLANADIRAGQWVEVVYDGTNMQMVSASGNAATVTVPGSDTQVIFNDSAALGADSGLLFNKTTDVLTALGGLVGGTTGTNDLTIDTSGVTGHKTWTAPNASGTIRLGTDISVSAKRTTDQTITNSTPTAVSMDAENYDTNSMHEAVTNPTRVTFTTAGKYTCSGNARFAASALGARSIAFFLNATTEIYKYRQPVNTAGNSTQITMTGDFLFSAADYIELRAEQDSGGDLAVVAVAGSPSLSCHKFD